MANSSLNGGLDWLRILLIAAGVFAIGSVGFFLAIVWENSTGGTGGAQSMQTLSVEQKSQVLNSLNSSASGSTSIEVHYVAAGSATSTGQPVLPSQADPNDQNAAAKLNALGSLNGTQ